MHLIIIKIIIKYGHHDRRYHNIIIMLALLVDSVVLPHIFRAVNRIFCLPDGTRSCLRRLISARAHVCILNKGLHNILRKLDRCN